MQSNKSGLFSGLREFGTELRVSIIATLSLAVLLCGFYPLVVWGLAQGLFPEQANGSLIVQQGRIVGSSLLAQRFSGASYFHPRPCAAGDGYDAAASGGSNLGPTAQKLIESVRQHVNRYRAENGLKDSDSVPADAVTTSASGIDPHISRKNAMLQAHRVARTRGMSEETILGKIDAHTQGRELGILGEPCVNVLELNLDLDGRR